MSAGNRIPTDGGAPLGQNPFAQLSPASGANTGYRKPASTEASVGRPETREQRSEVRGQRSEQATAETKNPPKNRGRVDITRQTAGRGGKTVTVASGFIGIGRMEKEQLAKKMQKACGAGGTVKDGCIEIQGDKREQVAKILAEAGFRPVFSGG
jgi:translation initiation factor 1